MNLVREISTAPMAGVEINEEPTGLAAIHTPSCAAAIWNRTPLAQFQTWIDALPPETLPKTRTILRPNAVQRAMRDIYQASDLPATMERDLLIDDVAALAEIFADTMQAPYLRMRLDVITTNACRKFHMDVITARLVCTYRGTGTQYGISQNGDDPARIETVGTGSPIVMRGSRWPTVPQSGLRHRSPPIEGTGETRLVLVLDPVQELGLEQGAQVFH
ncbi:hypothetical protein TRP8649_00829 [Pelagimonas phthalicica]|uniref:DUF1826 domain-containing protein n=1 Tax=Pelagimonas phthalicica TaxID=1037362 RepID=A0A238J942_9RHOB|nr:DUF1826 domain-containing protein [Pelagimonas phthalicica]TDS94728.1 uncharacterized protein DUF1826 [Pelagimonas phthalicica]SMX26744.1 hypothetical protein TRP8649_00829 [Pelagimonas phthalicica]